MKIVLTGGGTAGHIYPAINVGLYMRNHHNADVYFIGKKHSMEQKIAQNYNIPFYAATSQGLSMKKIIPFMIKNSVGTAEAMKLLKHLKPDYIFSTGGYVSAPVIAAANLLHIPYGIHEQNTVTGKVNRLFGKKATTQFYSFPIIETKTNIWTGNPVAFKERITFNGNRLVFMGGSGGSQSVNDFAISFAASHRHIPCTIITGEKRYQQTLAKGVPKNLEVISYTNDMLNVYRQAKLIVCRSGSGTLFEVANLNIPAILVPYPKSAEDHQKKNAEFFTQENAARLVEEGSGFTQKLTEEIEYLWKYKNERDKMKQNLLRLASPHSDALIAKRILEDVQRHGQ